MQNLSYSFHFDHFTPEREIVLKNTCDDELSSSKDSRSDSNKTNSGILKSRSNVISNLIPSDFWSSGQQNDGIKVDQQSGKDFTNNSSFNYLPIKAIYKAPNSRCENDLQQNENVNNNSDIVGSELTNEEKEEADRKLTLELKETLFIQIENEIKKKAKKELAEETKIIQDDFQQKITEISRQKKRDLEAIRLQNEIEKLLAKNK